MVKMKDLKNRYREFLRRHTYKETLSTEHKEQRLLHYLYELCGGSRES